MEAFTADELRRLERAHPDGLMVAALLELLRQRGIELADATFRKYVQLGLLPRSRRVGRKGKHRGSHGLYPVSCLGLVSEIRALMDRGLTLEEIQRSSVVLSQDVDTLRKAAGTLFDRLEAELERRPTQKTPAAQKRLAALRTQADALTDALDQAARELLPPEPVVHEEVDPLAAAREIVLAGDRARQQAKKPVKPTPRTPARPGPVRP